MDVLLIILWSLVSQQFLILIFDENMRLSFTKYKFKIFLEKFVSFYVDGYTFMPSTYNVFSVHNSFPLAAEEGQSWQGMKCKQITPNNSLIVIQGKVEEFNLTSI